MKKLSMAALRVMKIWQPPPPEQERIAEIVTIWDTAVAQMSKLIEAKRKLKKGLMQQLLTGKRRFPGFRSNWKEQRLAELADYHNGRAFKPEDWGDQGLPIIRIQNLNGSTEFNYYNGPYDKKHLVRDGDLLFSWSGSRGTSFGSFVWKGPEGLLNQHIFRVVPTGEVTKSYLGYLLRYTTSLIEQKAHGSAGLVHITKRELERFRVHFPSDQEEQKKIAAALYVADQEINSLSHLSNQLKEQKRGLMQKLLTGQIRVKGTDVATCMRKYLQYRYSCTRRAEGIASQPKTSTTTLSRNRPGQRRLDHHPRSSEARWGAERSATLTLVPSSFPRGREARPQDAVESKSFVGPSVVADLEQALGQYILYRDILARIEPERQLYLAIRHAVFRDLFNEPLGQVLLDNQRVQLVVFDPRLEVLVTWIP